MRQCHALGSAGDELIELGGEAVDGAAEAALAAQHVFDVAVTLGDHWGQHRLQALPGSQHWDGENEYTIFLYFLLDLKYVDQYIAAVLLSILFKYCICRYGRSYTKR